MKEMIVRENSFEAKLEAKKALVQNLYCRGSSAEEFEFFFHCCKMYGLNPFMRQIQYVQMGGKPTLIVTIDGLRAIAERTGMYAPGRDTEFTYGKDGKPISAKVFVKKMTRDGTWHEVSATALMSEYGRDRKGQGPVWKELPSVMLEKCAESRALRRAFSAAVAGLYIEEEMDIPKEELEKHRAQEQKEQESTLQEVTVDVQPSPEPVYTKSIEECKLLAPQLWAMLREKVSTLQPVAPEALAYHLLYVQQIRPHTEVTSWFTPWVQHAEKYLKSLDLWYESQGKGIMESMTVADDFSCQKVE
jgi:phage recombination protein Bet